MIRALRRRLALVFGLLTSLVLAGMMAVTLSISRTEYLTTRSMLYQTQLQTITVQLQNPTGLSDRLMNQLSQEQDAFFYAEWHGVPLHFSNVSTQTGARAALLERLNSEAERMGRLVADLLTLAREGAGQLDIQVQPVELETVCIRLYERFLPRAEQCAHSFSLQLPEEPLPVIPSDGERLVQLLSVLLDNALSHTPEGTEIALAARVSGGHALLSVVDHGPGIPDGEKQAVFRRFYRADPSRTDRRHFGLGLSIARELAGSLGAQLALTDTPGGGATFTLRLPLGKARKKWHSLPQKNPFHPGAGGVD